METQRLLTVIVYFESNHFKCIERWKNKTVQTVSGLLELEPA